MSREDYEGAIELRDRIRAVSLSRDIDEGELEALFGRLANCLETLARLDQSPTPARAELKVDRSLESFHRIVERVVQDNFGSVAQIESLKTELEAVAASFSQQVVEGPPPVLLRENSQETVIAVFEARFAEAERQGNELSALGPGEQAVVFKAEKFFKYLLGLSVLVGVYRQVYASARQTASTQEFADKLRALERAADNCADFIVKAERSSGVELARLRPPSQGHLDFESGLLNRLRCSGLLNRDITCEFCGGFIAGSEQRQGVTPAPCSKLLSLPFNG